VPRKIKRTAFFVSDGTGLTAEALGYSLMTQFEKVEFKQIRITEAEKMMRREGIRWLDSSTKSIEEISTTILQELKLG